MKNKLEYSSLLDNINEVNISTANNVAGQIAAKVKERRQELGLTKTEMAFRAGVKYTHYCRFEQTGEIPFKELLQIGFALNALPDFDNLFASRQYKSLDEVPTELQDIPKSRKINDDNGDYFTYQQYVMTEIARCIECDIARALRPKPATVHEDYWGIISFEIHKTKVTKMFFPQYFKSLKEAESYLASQYNVVKSDYKEVCPENSWKIFEDTVVFQSMDTAGTSDDEQIPVLHSIRHYTYDRYPFDALVLTDETIETMKEAYRQIRVAGIYVNCVDWMMTVYDRRDLEAKQEDALHKRLKDELAAFDKEFKTKNWTESR